MATKTLKSKDKAEPEVSQETEVKPNPRSTFLQKSFPRKEGQSVEVNHVFGHAFRVNVREKVQGGMEGLNTFRMVDSKFVYVDGDGEDMNIRDATRR